MPRPTGRALPFAIVALSLVAAACSKSPGGDRDALPAACRPDGSENAAKAVLRCTEGSIAFVETDAGSGTGIVIEVAGRRYILTNQHVVDPFAAADATVGPRSFPDLAVRGVDSAADIAVLGPLPGAGDLPPPLAIGDGLDLERGDQLFLVGFPGESGADDLEATIASGIVSRLRAVEEFGQAYIQTDASIGGGQSGGPLFDASARLVGISGLSFAEEFALALSGRDAKEAVDRILRGDGDDYLALPPRAGQATGTSGTLRLHEGTDVQVLFLPAAGEDRTWHLTVDMAARPTVSVHDWDDEPLAASANTASVMEELSRQMAARRREPADDRASGAGPRPDPEVAARETSPGRFTIPVKADVAALVYVDAPLTDAPVEVAWQSDLPLVPASRPVSEQTIAVGGQVDRVLGSFDTSVDVLVDLAAGQRVRLHARSPQGDTGFDVYTPQDRLDHLTVADPELAGIEIFDDTDDGLYGLDALTTYRAETAGTYRFRVYSNDTVAIHVRFSVTDCTIVDC